MQETGQVNHSAVIDEELSSFILDLLVAEQHQAFIAFDQKTCPKKPVVTASSMSRDVKMSLLLTPPRGKQDDTISMDATSCSSLGASTASSVSTTTTSTEEPSEDWSILVDPDNKYGTTNCTLTQKLVGIVMVLFLLSTVTVAATMAIRLEATNTLLSAAMPTTSSHPATVSDTVEQVLDCSVPMSRRVATMDLRVAGISPLAVYRHHRA